MTTSSAATVRSNSWRRTVLITSLAVIAGTLGLAATPAMAGSKTPFNTNLVKNPGFEAGPASPAGNTTVRIPSWHRDGPATVVAYGTSGGFPTAAEGHRISGGHKFAASGSPDAVLGCGFLTQLLALKGRDAAIDAGQLAVRFGGRVGTYDSQPDTAHILVTFFAADDDQIDNEDLTLSGTNGTMVPWFASRIVPAGTRSLSILLYASDTVGYCDAYFDRISLKLIKV